MIFIINKGASHAAVHTVSGCSSSSTRLSCAAAGMMQQSLMRGMISVCRLPHPEFRGGCLTQGHALFTRQAGGVNPCPALDFTGGFNKLMAAAYGIDSVQGKYGVAYGDFLT